MKLQTIEQLTRSWSEVEAPDPQRAADPQLVLELKLPTPREQLTCSWCKVEASDQKAADPQLV